MIFDSVGEKYNGFRALRQIAIELGLEAYLEDEHRIRFVDPKTTEKRFMFVPDLSMYGYMDTRKRASICQELARIFHMEPLQPKSQKTSFYLIWSIATGIWLVMWLLGSVFKSSSK